MIPGDSTVAMAAEISLLRKSKRRGFMPLLSAAACEWLLMFLLFVDAALSYLLMRFAEYCELQAPCMLCSRLNNKKNGCYWSSLCSEHREGLSSLVFCSVHGKFANVNGMCEECLFPHAKQTESNSESYRLLVGKSFVDVDRSVIRNLVMNKSIKLCSQGRRTCSCCSRIFRTRSNAERLFELGTVGLGASKANVKPPLPRTRGRSRFSNRDGLKRLRDKFTGSKAPQDPSGSSSVEPLSHVGYTKLKISFDSESELQYSEDDEDHNSGFRCTSCRKIEYEAQSDARDIDKPPADYAASEKKRVQDSEVNPSVILDQPNLLDLSDPKNENSLSSDAFMEQVLIDLNWQESSGDPGPLLAQELTSLVDGPQPPEAATGSFGASADTCLPHMPAISILSEFLSLCSSSPLANNEETPKKIDAEDASLAKQLEPVSGTSADDSSQSNIVNDANVLAQSDENVELSDGRSFEPIDASDSSIPGEHKYRRREESTPEWGIPSSPRANEKQQEPRGEILPMKKDYSFESLDGLAVSDVEGENIVDRLKRQIEHDQNCMNSLYKELEEERNAAAIAANETMAMITRLQEEKAALQMEALQYLRMMEEQAEYDMEALERANDLLAEKDKEKQDLEYELEFYRNNFLDESGVVSIRKEASSALLNDGAAQNENAPSNSSNSSAAKIPTVNGNHKPIGSSIQNFEFEKLRISKCLRKMERKICQVNCSGESGDMPNSGLDAENSNKEVGDLEHLSHNGLNGSPTEHGHEHDVLCGHSERFAVNLDQIDAVAFEKQISELRDQLEALDSDRSFLKHACDLLENGNEGLELVQEIAHHLQELRKMELKNR